MHRTSGSRLWLQVDPILGGSDAKESSARVGTTFTLDFLEIAFHSRIPAIFRVSTYSAELVFQKEVSCAPQMTGREKNAMSHFEL